MFHDAQVRLGRSLPHLLSIVNTLKDRQVAFRSLTEGMGSGRSIFEQVQNIDIRSLKGVALEVGILAVRVGRNSHVPDKHVRKTYEVRLSIATP